MTVTDGLTHPTGLPTLADVAHLAGVSSATASRVLTGSARVRPQTRDRVEQAISRLGYVRNRAARSPSSRRAGSVALVMGEETVKVFADPFFARMLGSVSRELSLVDFQLVMLTLHSPRDHYTVSRYLRSGHVDGALFVSMHDRLDFDYESLGIPVVLCGRPVAGGGALSYVDADNTGGASAAVRYLLENGRRAVATIAGPPDMAVGIDRLLGYRQALCAVGVLDPGMIAYGDFSRMSGQHALLRLIDHRPGIDAVFAASDLMAAGALHALRRLGRRVPHDVAVIGFDDLPAAQQTDPGLTTVRQPVGAMGTRMVTEILAQIADPGREPSRVVLDTQLILRGSALRSLAPRTRPEGVRRWHPRRTATTRRSAMTQPPGTPAMQRTPLSADESARAEANFLPYVAEALVAKGRFRVTADSPEMVELFQKVARRAGDVLRRPVVSYANGREIVITFGHEASGLNGPAAGFTGSQPSVRPPAF